MKLFFILVILAGITYLLVRRNVSGLTSTPVWLLSLALMLPALSWSAWIVVRGEPKEVPPQLIILMIGSVITSILLYSWLLQRGRKDSKPSVSSHQENPTPETMNPWGINVSSSPSQSTQLLSKEEEQTLKTCFPWDVYYLQNVDYGGQAVLCRGKLRTGPEKAYERITNNIKRHFGDRFFIIFQENLQGDPFFALVPNYRQQQNQAQQQDELNQPKLAVALAFVTLFTTTMVGTQFAGFEIEKIQSDSKILLEGLPYSIALMLILACHEFSHYLTAIYYNIRATLPYFIPIPFFLGTFGAFIQMRSPVPHRKALFDVAIAGPLGGFLVTVPILLWGLSLSEVVPLSEESALWNIESLDPRSSLLMTIFSKIALGNEFVSETAIDLHPMAIAGYIGVIVTALNLMPVGQLDGGHIVHAVYGQRTALIVGQISKILMLILAFQERIFIFWAIFLFFMPVMDEPALNDVSELDNVRDFLGFLALVLLVTILLPLPATLTDFLNV